MLGRKLWKRQTVLSFGSPRMYILTIRLYSRPKRLSSLGAVVVEAYMRRDEGI